jgi:signal peptidase I
MDQDFLIHEHQQIESQREVRKVLQHRERKPLWREYLETAIVALVAATLLRIFVVSAYKVNSASMEDTLYNGDYIFVNKLAYDYGTDPKPGDIIVFKYPNNPEKEYIKRIVAGPGQTVEVADKVVYIDGEVAPIPPKSKHVDKRIIPGDLSFRDNFAAYTVPDGEYFVMGDNRDDSKDSRFWGTVPRQNIKGKAVFIYWSWEPDPNAPGWSFPYVDDLVLWIGHGIWNFPTNVRWDRIVTSI